VCKYEVLTAVSTKMAVVWVVPVYTALQPRRQSSKCERFWWGSPEEIDNSEDRSADGMMGSKCILGR
jgi:hypothetical protein